MIANKGGFSVLLETFLDTTPRQWIQYFSGKISAIGLSLHPKSVVAALKGQMRTKSSYGFYGSIVLHCVALMLMGIDVGAVLEEVMESEESKAQQALAAQQQAAPASSSDRPKEIVEVTGIYYISPEDLYPNKKNKKRKKKPQSALKSFLSQVRGQSNMNTATAQTSTGSGFKVTGVQTSGGGAEGVIKSNAKVGGWAEELELSKKNTSFEDVEGELNKHLARYNTQFRGCYERALMKDESLNANIKFLLKVGKNRNISQASIDFDGVGRPESKALLQNCLKNIARKITLPEKSKQLVGKKLKFYVVLNSWK